ncbi:hypothetical protein EVG20_g9593 [Dentipellis fragilis]|uniref:Uncharacterized protein n=1 Tax=Dentipellis fragilis TaxID=205917 RepID=A0A4Y9Y1H9_9AGAM|nr:hypothetical protein EVG20_g9593 [Dentipellis fragilis]
MLQNMGFGDNRGLGLGPSSRRAKKKKLTKKPQYVRFHGDDDPSIYPEAFFSHPDKFEPHKSWDGKIIWWGVQPVFPKDHEYEGSVDHGEGEDLMMRKMAANLYSDNPRFDGTPEQQFVNRLIEPELPLVPILQIEKLSKLDLGDLQSRDYTLKIVMDEIHDAAGHDRIWREFRVSGGLSISALADKVLTPLMGWYVSARRTQTSNLKHVHKDGAVYGPTIGYGAVPEKSNHGVWTLAHLLQAEGESMVWLYDYGDNWKHTITVEEIAPVSESTGKVAILDGAGACPREDGSGNHIWVEDLQKLRSGSIRERNEVLTELRKALNYKGKPIGVDFDPDAFDLAEARARVHAALASPDSVWSGPKSFVYPLCEEAMDSPSLATADAQKRGQTLERTWEGRDDGDRKGRFMQEITTSKRDKKVGGCCWNCGSPHNLSGCSRCKKTLYCGTECQKQRALTQLSSLEQVALSSLSLDGDEYEDTMAGTPAAMKVGNGALDLLGAMDPCLAAETALAVQKQRVHTAEALAARDAIVQHLSVACRSLKEKNTIIEALKLEKEDLQRKLDTAGGSAMAHPTIEGDEDEDENVSTLEPQRMHNIVQDLGNEIKMMRERCLDENIPHEAPPTYEEDQRASPSPPVRQILSRIATPDRAAQLVRQDALRALHEARSNNPSRMASSPGTAGRKTPEPLRLIVQEPNDSLTPTQVVTTPQPVGAEDLIKSRNAILASLPLPTGIPADSLRPILIPAPFTLHEFLSNASGSLRNSLSNYRVFQQLTTSWCPEREEHGYFLAPLFKCSTNPRVATAHRWSSVDVVGRMSKPTECFYNKDGKWYYAGIYKAFRLDDLTTREWEHLSPETAQALIKETLACRKNTSPQNIYETTQLFSAGALKIACVGLQCIGFNNALYRTVLEQASKCTQSGRWRDPFGPGTPTSTPAAPWDANTNTAAVAGSANAAMAFAPFSALVAFSDVSEEQALAGNGGDALSTGDTLAFS